MSCLALRPEILGTILSGPGGGDGAELRGLGSRERGGGETDSAADDASDGRFLPRSHD